MKNKRDGKKNKSSRSRLSGLLTGREVEILQYQIQANSLLIDHYIRAIDLLANKERCPKDANTLVRLRTRLSVAIAENDTFRKVLWRHAQLSYASSPDDGEVEAIAFLVGRIKTRREAAISQMAMK